MSSSKDHYDSNTKTYWLYRDYDEELVPDDELQAWSKVAREGKSSKGEDVAAVNYIFKDRATAEYNHPALQFARVGTYIGKLGDATSFDGEDVSFDTREDFGI